MSQQENLIEKFIGVLPENKHTKGNIGQEWYLDEEDGLYHCDTKRFTLTPAQIYQDFKNGYLVRATEKENNG